MSSSKCISLYEIGSQQLYQYYTVHTIANASTLRTSAVLLSSRKLIIVSNSARSTALVAAKSQAAEADAQATLVLPLSDLRPVEEATLAVPLDDRE